MFVAVRAKKRPALWRVFILDFLQVIFGSADLGEASFAIKPHLKEIGRLFGVTALKSIIMMVLIQDMLKLEHAFYRLKFRCINRLKMLC